MNKPIIASKTQNYGIEGDTLEFNCTVEVSLGTELYMTWITPNENIAKQVCWNEKSLNFLQSNVHFNSQEGRIEIAEPVRGGHQTHPEFYLATGKLTVKSLDKTKDAGIYKCMVEDLSSNRNSALINIIKILGNYRRNLDQSLLPIV